MGQKLEKILDCEEKEVGYDDSDEDDDAKGPKDLKKQEKSLGNESSLAQSMKESSMADKAKSNKMEENAMVKPKISNFMTEEDKIILQGQNPEEGRSIKPYNES